MYMYVYMYMYMYAYIYIIPFSLKENVFENILCQLSAILFSN